MGVVGADIRTNVRKQLQAREQLYAGTNRDVPTIQTQNSTAWARLASSVNIDGSSQEAKNFVLFGGTAESNAAIKAQPNSYFVETYSFNPTQGYRPNPGIETLDFKYKNNGALASCDITIKCFTFEQFNIIEKLYLRPGYSILVEWGHAKYVTNQNQPKALQRGDVDGALSTFLNGNKNQGVLINKIKKQKESTDFNYDGFFGKIVNFQWTFNADLSYSITIKTITHGDIIENLKINTATPESLEIAKKEREERKAKVEKQAEEGNTFVDSLGNGLSFVGKQIASFFTSFLAGSRDLLGDIIDVIDDQTFISKLLANRTKSQIHKILYSLAINFPNLSASDTVGDLKVEKLQNTTGVPAKSNAASKGSVVQVQPSECIRVAFDVSSADDQDLGNYQYYLTFGALLKIIEQTIFQDEAGLPLVSIDCGYGTTGMVTFPGQISADPLTCLIPFVAYPKVQGKNLTYSGFNYEVLNDDGIKKEFLLDDTGAIGDLMKVMLNFNFIMKVFDENTDEEGDLALIDFVQKILDGITLAVGGINKFQTRVIHEGLKDNDNESRPYLSIYDEGAHIQAVEEERTTLKPYGVTNTKGSTFLDISFSSELSNEFASQISIGAQANGNQPGENATAFSQFNQGLEDRMIAKKQKPGTSEDAEGETDPYVAFGTTLLELQESTNEFYKFGELDKDIIKTAVSSNSTYAKFCIGDLATTEIIPAPFFIPFNLQIKMKGVSGIRIFDKVYLEDTILPKSYRGKVAFILKGVNHSVSGNEWTTTLETLTVPVLKTKNKISSSPGEAEEPDSTRREARKKKLDDAKQAMKAAEDKRNREQDVAGTGGTVSTGTGKTLIKNYPYNGKFFSTTSKKSQITLHYTVYPKTVPLSRVVADFSSRTTGVSTHFILDKDGSYDQLYPYDKWGYHLGVNTSAGKDIDKSVNPKITRAQYKRRDPINVGIEINNVGMLQIKNGKYRDTINTSINYPESEVSKSVDKNGNPTKWKGFLYWEKFPEAQIRALESLIYGIIGNNPDISPKGKPWKFVYEDCFPGYGKTSGKALKGEPGIYTHNSFRFDKFDVPPVPEIIDMLKRIEKNLNEREKASQPAKNCPNVVAGYNKLLKNLREVSATVGYQWDKKSWVNNDKKKEFGTTVQTSRNAWGSMKNRFSKLNEAKDANSINLAKQYENDIKTKWKGNAYAWAIHTYVTLYYKSPNTTDDTYENRLEARFNKVTDKSKFGKNQFEVDL